MLTRKQHELLVFINDCLNRDGFSPSFDEMKDALGLKSKSGIHRLITGLEERGFIRRLPHRARALEVLRLPDDSQGAEDNVVTGRFRPRPPEPEAPAPSAATAVPLYGRIAAGTPIEALRDHSNTIDVPAMLLSGSRDHYTLEVAGDSMIDAGIQDGDLVVIARCADAENGTIVVALVDDHEVTLKRLRRRGDSIALEPANASYETRIFGPDRVQIQGRLVGLLRRY